MNIFKKFFIVLALTMIGSVNISAMEHNENLFNDDDKDETIDYSVSPLSNLLKTIAQTSSFTITTYYFPRMLSKYYEISRIFDSCNFSELKNQTLLDYAAQKLLITCDNVNAHLVTDTVIIV